MTTEMISAFMFYGRCSKLLVHVAMVLAILTWESRAGVRSDLELLRNRCLYFSVGHAPNDTNTVTLRHGLYSQSPFSPVGEIDLAASGFALAALPSAVECGLITSNSAKAIATNAAQQVLALVTKSAAATNVTDRGRYGYMGMLYHYYVWNDGAGEFRAGPGVEVSSIDTTLLMYGLLVCANYFGEPVMTNYLQARDAIAWSDWLDSTTPGHSNQFYMAYTTSSGLTGHWDWRSDETALICVFAAMSDPNLNARTIWNAWTRDTVTYTSPPPVPTTFTCYASWNGDPFTDFYGLELLDTARFPNDFNGVDWFRNNSVSYKGHVEFFRKERGYLDYMTAAFVAGTANPIAAPKSDPAAPPVRVDCPLYSLAGGLPFYSPVPESNEIARTISLLVTNTPGAALFQWHGWPAEAVSATSATHGVVNNAFVGQDICAIALSIDNYLTNRIQNIVLRDARLRHVLNEIWPPKATRISALGDQIYISWNCVPQGEYALFSASQPNAGWVSNGLQLRSDCAGQLATTGLVQETARFYYLSEF